MAENPNPTQHIVASGPTGVTDAKGVYYTHDAPQATQHLHTLWIVENERQVAGLWQAGYPNSIAVMDWNDETMQIIRNLTNGERCKFIFPVSEMRDMKTILPPFLSMGEVVVFPTTNTLENVTMQTAKSMLFNAQDAIEYVLAWEQSNVVNMEQPTPYEEMQIQDTVVNLIAAVTSPSLRNIYVKRLYKAAGMKMTDMREVVEEKAGKALAIMIAHLQEIGAMKADDGYNEFVKVADDYYQRTIVCDEHTKTYSTDYTKRKFAEICKERGKAYANAIERYDSWTIIPTHTDFQKIFSYQYDGLKNRQLNRYYKLSHEPKAFELPLDWQTMDYADIPQIHHIARYFKHLANYDQYGSQFVTLLWDYIAIMYLYPTRKLRMLALVSTEEGTGKSTMIDFCREVFGHNATTTTTDGLTAKFNSELAGKILVAIEETSDQRVDLENRLKDLITGKQMKVEYKNIDSKAVANFIKIMVASNHPEEFLKVGTNTTRHAVLHVPKVKASDMDTKLMDKMKAEIPHFLYFLQQRGVVHPDTDRLWHDTALWENDALLKLRAASKDIVVTEIEHLIENMFIRTTYLEPVMKLSADYLQKLMAKSSHKFKDKTATHFSNVARNKMGLKQSPYPMKYKYPFLMADKELSDKATWDYAMEEGNTRYLEFPIYRFVHPETMKQVYTPVQLAGFITALQGVDAAAGWLAALQSDDSEATTVQRDGDAPF